ncbi:MAG: AAA family ATPase [Candidatus Aminicenantia bacterium]
MEQRIDEISSKVFRVIENLEKVIIGKSEVIKLALTSLFAGGHLLIEDVPGTGKTTLALGIAKSIGGIFRRIQFTSDLLPSDIIGVTIYSQKNESFEFKAGPIFANIVLADEINRTTPKTQSALLESMNENQVTVDNITYPLPRPFMVIATQNPLEIYGTYPLPESQLDRFMMRIKMGYPPTEKEKGIIISHRFSSPLDNITSVITTEEVVEIQKRVKNVKISSEIMDYIVEIIKRTRNSDLIKIGASPRASILFSRACQAYAFVNARDYVIPDDVKALSIPILVHRVIPKGKISDGRREEVEDIIKDIIYKVTVPL